MIITNVEIQCYCNIKYKLTPSLLHLLVYLDFAIHIGDVHTFPISKNYKQTFDTPSIIDKLKKKINEE